MVEQCNKNIYIFENIDNINEINFGINNNFNFKTSISNQNTSNWKNIKKNLKKLQILNIFLLLILYYYL